jgi:adenosylmethionine-8-amino-7-oxononanoate aminotransferase
MVGLAARDKKVIWHPFTQVATSTEVIGIVRGEGCWIVDENGKRYLDGVSSWWVNAHGHAHPHLANAVAKQAHELEHIIFAGFTHEPAVKLAETLIDILPGLQSRIFYSDNGSTSVEVALKMAIQYFANKGKPRRKIIAFEQAYHGDTFGSMSVGARNAFNLPFHDFLFEVIHIPAPEKNYETESLSRFQEVLDDDVAAFIFEPLVQGANGMRMHNASTLSQMIALARNVGALTIADEVFTGFYRTGKLFACSNLSEQPDIMCLSKTLTGGMFALGVTAAPEFLYEEFISFDNHKTFFHGHSYTANPIACAAANASLELLLKESCLDAVKQIEHYHQQFALKLEISPRIMEVRVLGTILAIELKTQDERGYMSTIAADATSFFMERGIYLRPLGNVIYCTPPYCINKEELEMIYNAILAYLGFSQ